MRTVTASQARQTLPAQLDRVSAGEAVAITRHGEVVAVLVHPGTVRIRRAKAAWDYADNVAELLEQARSETLRDPTVSRERADELVADIRSARSER